MKDREHKALEQHLFELRKKALEGDKTAVNDMTLWVDALLQGKVTQEENRLAERKKAGAARTKQQERAILLLAVPAYKRARKVDRLFFKGDPWGLIVDEVVASAQEGVEVIDISTGKTKLVKVKDKRAVVKMLNKYRSFIEGMPRKSSA